MTAHVLVDEQAMDSLPSMCAHDAAAQHTDAGFHALRSTRKPRSHTIVAVMHSEQTTTWRQPAPALTWTVTEIETLDYLCVRSRTIHQEHSEFCAGCTG